MHAASLTLLGATPTPLRGVVNCEYVNLEMPLSLPALTEWGFFVGFDIFILAL